ncbi:MAG: zinc metalloprotease HtpX [Candidatus Marsarchaeota archaeon]|jgi:heat shock protein HtpX|nr:zinc metalloprotease HtpX [Candidatus Marsarchaeota archaeon]MCL5418758.1 zinc metalloprotease HtpX [Candidatus Marsarchaeota archaeon]
MAVYGLKARMYIVLALILAIGFGVIYALLYVLGVSAAGMLAFAAIYFAFQWYISPKAISLFSRLKYISDAEYPDLHRMVTELANEAQVPVPRIAISPSKEPNAFVFGRTRKSATLAVHQGLLDMLDREELKAVLAHEIGHIKHSDFAVITFISFIPMLAMLIAEYFLFFGMFGNSRQGTGYLALFGAGAFVIYVITELFMLSLSRSRELYADNYSATATQKPEYLARALVKITYGQAASPQQNAAPQAARSLYIADSTHARKEAEELIKHKDEISKILSNAEIERLMSSVSAQRRGSFISSIFSTHPSTYTRLLLLAKAKGDIDAGR